MVTLKYSGKAEVFTDDTPNVEFRICQLCRDGFQVRRIDEFDWTDENGSAHREVIEDVYGPFDRVALEANLGKNNTDELLSDENLLELGYVYITTLQCADELSAPYIRECLDDRYGGVKR